MPTNLPAPTTPFPVSLEIAGLASDAAAFINASRAANTRRAYEADWTDFTTWCSKHGAVSVPADPRVVALYLTDLAKGAPGRRPRSVATIDRRLAAIQHYQRAAGHELDLRDDTLRSTWRGIKRTYGRAPKTKQPTVTAFLRLLVETCPTDTLIGLRDKAILLVGFAGCFRRSELVSLDVADCVFDSEKGLVLTLRRSKGDQEAVGMVKGITYGANPDTCPVRALSAWLEAAGITEGPVFRPVTRYETLGPRRLRSERVALIVKRAVSAAQAAAIARGKPELAKALDPKRYAGHSLRAGFITSAAAAGVQESDIMRHSGHKRSDTLRKYIRPATVFVQNATAKVGL